VSHVSVAQCDLKGLAYLDGSRAVDNTEAHGCVLCVCACVSWYGCLGSRWVKMVVIVAFAGHKGA
jgi:hypothetical protein